MANRTVELARKLLANKLPDAVIQSKKIRGKDRYQLAVISDTFNRKSHFKRQDAIWELLYNALEPTDFIKISLVIPVTYAEAKELTGENIKPPKSRVAKSVKIRESNIPLGLKS